MRDLSELGIDVVYRDVDGTEYRAGEQFEFLLRVSVENRWTADTAKLAERIETILRPLSIGDGDFDRSHIARAKRGGIFAYVATWTTTREDARSVPSAIAEIVDTNANLVDRIDSLRATVNAPDGSLLAFATLDYRGGSREATLEALKEEAR